MAEGMHRHAGPHATSVSTHDGHAVTDFRMLGEQVIDCFRRQAESFAIDVDKQRLRAAIADRVAGRDKGQGLRDHQIALADADKVQRCVQRRRAIHHRDCAYRASTFGEGPFELVDIRANARHESG